VHVRDLALSAKPVLDGVRQDLLRQSEYEHGLAQIVDDVVERVTCLERLELARAEPLPDLHDYVSPISREELDFLSKEQLPPLAPDLRGQRLSRLEKNCIFLATAGVDHAALHHLDQLKRVHYLESPATFVTARAYHAFMFLFAFASFYCQQRDARNMRSDRNAMP
jgi:hypothetical protein